jgi:hypothetical protein
MFGDVKLILWDQTSVLSEMMRSWMCFPHVSKMPNFTYYRANSVFIWNAIKATLVRKDMDVNEHEKLSNVILRHTLKRVYLYCRSCDYADRCQSLQCEVRNGAFPLPNVYWRLIEVGMCSIIIRRVYIDQMKLKKIPHRQKMCYAIWFSLNIF